MRRAYPARPEAVPRVRAAAAGCARELGADDSVAQAVALAVTEACSNVVLHAYRQQKEPGEMTIVVEKPDEHLCITVLDDGVGIVPRPDSPGLGMGLPLISQLSDSVELRSRTEGGSEVSMRFAVAARAAVC